GYRLQRGLSHAMLGQAQLAAGEPGPALESFGDARKVFEQLVREYPRVPAYQRRFEQVCRDMAQIYVNSRQDDLAVSAYEQTLESMKKRLELWPGDAGELYGAARDLALAAAGAKGRPASRRCADLALEALRQAAKAGFRDAERARTDPALEPLRAREE